MTKLDGVTHQAEPLKRLEGMKKDRIALRRLGLMVRPDDIWLDSLI